jgi:hypothetical protein
MHLISLAGTTQFCSPRSVSVIALVASSSNQADFGLLYTMPWHTTLR